MGLAFAIYGPLTAITWERGPLALLEKFRYLAPEGSEIDQILSCAICLTPWVVLPIVLGLTGLTINSIWIGLMTWGWLWVMIRMTRFGKA